MSIKDRFHRLVSSRKSLSSGHSSASSNSDTSERPPMPYSSGTSTPTSSSTMPITTAALPRVPAGTPLNPSPTSATGPSSSLQSSSGTGNFLSKTLTWRSSHGGDRDGKREKKRSSSGKKNKEKELSPQARRRLHPSERPLTEANLRQQEMLAQFKWEFGRSSGRRNSLGGWSVDSGISPCQSRRGSLAPPPFAP